MYTVCIWVACERRIVIIDGPDSWAKELVTEGKAESFYGIDFTDETTIFDRCLAKVKQVEKVSAQRLAVRSARALRACAVPSLRTRPYATCPSMHNVRRSFAWSVRTSSRI